MRPRRPSQRVFDVVMAIEVVLELCWGDTGQVLFGLREGICMTTLEKIWKRDRSFHAVDTRAHVVRAWISPHKQSIMLSTSSCGKWRGDMVAVVMGEWE